MTVQELIDELNKIENKDKPIFVTVDKEAVKETNKNDDYNYLYYGTTAKALYINDKSIINVYLNFS